MHVNDVNRVGGKHCAYLSVGTWMDRQTRGDVRGYAMDGDAVEDLGACEDLARASGGGDDPHVMARGYLVEGQRAHLSLDTARTGQVAVTDVGDPHSGDRTPQWVHHDISTRL